MARSFTFAEAADELRVSPRWLRYWLAEHPVDAAVVPFYVPMGRNKTFEPADIDRIRAHIRDLERVRLGPRATATAGTARLIGQLAQFGGDYDELVKMREAEKRKKEAEKAKRPPQRRVRIPRFKPKVED